VIEVLCCCGWLCLLDVGEGALLDDERDSECWNQGYCKGVTVTVGLSGGKGA